MKNLLFLLAAILISSSALMSQSVPAGMRFQAIARSLDGSLLTAQALIVKVELLSAGEKENIFYSEMHDVKSSDLGLLDFVIGEGTQSSGKFSEIPWATEDVWVRISVKSVSDDDYQIISSGQLYSVPYALYANSAGSIVDQQSDHNGGRGLGGNLDQTAIYWALDGNTNSHKYKGGGQAVLGTTDRKDLVMVTQNIPRLIIDKDGNITIMLNIVINGNLNVDGNTTLNGSLDVTNMSPTHFSGRLTVDKATFLNDILTVANMAPTLLSGPLTTEKTLYVKGATTLNSTLDVTGMSATHLTGTLVTDKASALNGLNVMNLSQTQLTGSLDVDKTMNVDGATTLNNTLDVSGVTHLSGTLVVDKATTLNSTLTVANLSATQLTGTLDVDKTLNVDEATTLNNGLDVTGMSATHLTGTLTEDKATTLNNALTVTNSAPTHLTGDLVVDGSVNIDGDITLNGPLNVNGMNPTTLTGTLEVDKLATFLSGMSISGGGTVGPDGTHLAFFDNEEGGTSDGIAIKINNSGIDKENNFMTFYKGTGAAVAGRIEGYEFDDIADIPVPTSDEIWTAVCVAIADYNPITIAWTQFAGAFNLVSSGWNNVTIPSFDIPDIPPFTIPDIQPLTIPDIQPFVIPDIPGVTIPDVPGVVIPDVPELVVGPYLCVSACICPCDILDPLNFNCCCGTVCAIPEFTLFPGITIPDFPGIAIPDVPAIPIPDFPGIPIPDFPGIAIPDFPGLVIPAVPEINLKNLFGEAPTIPTFSDILVSQGICPNADIFNINNGYVRRLADWALENRLQSLVTIDPIALVANGLAWGLTSSVLDGGVVYGSKGADYAEYLPKVYPTEQFMKGDIVGVYNGRISKNTRYADQVLAITSQPLVLGNMPADDKVSDFEQVAFLGQVPVYVKGPVKLGDYILPSGNNDGIALAVPAGSLTTEMLSMVLGKAWSDYAGDGVTLINTSIGLRPMEISLLLQKQGDVEDALQNQMKLQREDTEVMTNDIEQMKHKLGLSATTYNP
ncbi:MAG: hypothetical protein WAT91_18665 [Saprospiraceae bacterium]